MMLALREALEPILLRQHAERLWGQSVYILRASYHRNSPFQMPDRCWIKDGPLFQVSERTGKPSSQPAEQSDKLSPQGKPEGIKPYNVDKGKPEGYKPHNMDKGKPEGSKPYNVDKGRS